MSKKKQQFDETRAKLVRLARAAFAEQGYAEAATNELVARAGMTRGALYYQFRDKRDLFQAVVVEAHAEIAAEIQRAAATAPDAWAALVARFETLTFDRGDVLVAEGQDSNGLFLVASGDVAVEREDADGERLRLATLGPGDVVGEISLVLRRPANATVTALEPTVAMRLSREEFQRAIKEHPTLLPELYELASKRDEETRTVVAQQAIDAGDVVLL